MLLLSGEVDAFVDVIRFSLSYVIGTKFIDREMYVFEFASVFKGQGQDVSTRRIHCRCKT